MIFWMCLMLCFHATCLGNHYKDHQQGPETNRDHKRNMYDPKCLACKFDMTDPRCLACKHKHHNSLHGSSESNRDMSYRECLKCKLKLSHNPHGSSEMKNDMADKKCLMCKLKFPNNPYDFTGTKSKIDRFRNDKHHFPNSSNNSLNNYKLEHNFDINGNENSHHSRRKEENNEAQNPLSDLLQFGSSEKLNSKSSIENNKYSKAPKHTHAFNIPNNILYDRIDHLQVEPSVPQLMSHVRNLDQNDESKSLSKNTPDMPNNNQNKKWQHFKDALQKNLQMQYRNTDHQPPLGKSSRIHEYYNRKPDNEYDNANTIANKFSESFHDEEELDEVLPANPKYNQNEDEGNVMSNVHVNDLNEFSKEHERTNDNDQALYNVRRSMDNELDRVDDRGDEMINGTEQNFTDSNDTETDNSITGMTDTTTTTSNSVSQRSIDTQEVIDMDDKNVGKRDNSDYPLSNHQEIQEKEKNPHYVYDDYADYTGDEPIGIRNFDNINNNQPILKKNVLSPLSETTHTPNLNFDEVQSQHSPTNVNDEKEHFSAENNNNDGNISTYEKKGYYNGDKTAKEGFDKRDIDNMNTLTSDVKKDTLHHFLDSKLNAVDFPINTIHRDDYLPMKDSENKGNNPMLEDYTNNNDNGVFGGKASEDIDMSAFNMKEHVSPPITERTNMFKSNFDKAGAQYSARNSKNQYEYFTANDNENKQRHDIRDYGNSDNNANGRFLRKDFADIDTSTSYTDKDDLLHIPKSIGLFHVNFGEAGSRYSVTNPNSQYEYDPVEYDDNVRNRLLHGKKEYDYADNNAGRGFEGRDFLDIVSTSNAVKGVSSSSSGSTTRTNSNSDEYESQYSVRNANNQGGYISVKNDESKSHLIPEKGDYDYFDYSARDKFDDNEYGLNASPFNRNNPLSEKGVQVSFHNIKQDQPTQYDDWEIGLSKRDKKSKRDKNNILIKRNSTEENTTNNNGEISNNQPENSSSTENTTNSQFYTNTPVLGTSVKRENNFNDDTHARQVNNNDVKRNLNFPNLDVWFNKEMTDLSEPAGEYQDKNYRQNNALEDDQRDLDYLDRALESMIPGEPFQPGFRKNGNVHKMNQMKKIYPKLESPQNGFKYSNKDPNSYINGKNLTYPIYDNLIAKQYPIKDYETRVNLINSSSPIQKLFQGNHSISKNSTIRNNRNPHNHPDTHKLTNRELTINEGSRKVKLVSRQVKDHQQNSENNYSTKNELSPTSFIPPANQTEPMNFDFIDKTNDAITKEMLKAPHINEEMARVSEDFKTRQTIMRDLKTKKETNVLENENKKVFDNLHLESDKKNNDDKDIVANSEYNELSLPLSTNIELQNNKAKNEFKDYQNYLYSSVPEVGIQYGMNYNNKGPEVGNQYGMNYNNKGSGTDNRYGMNYNYGSEADDQYEMDYNRGSGVDNQYGLNYNSDSGVDNQYGINYNKDTGTLEGNIQSYKSPPISSMENPQTWEQYSAKQQSNVESKNYNKDTGAPEEKIQSYKSPPIPSMENPQAWEQYSAKQQSNVDSKNYNKDTGAPEGKIQSYKSPPVPSIENPQAWKQYSAKQPNVVSKNYSKVTGAAERKTQNYKSPPISRMENPQAGKQYSNKQQPNVDSKNKVINYPPPRLSSIIKWVERNENLLKNFTPSSSNKNPDNVLESGKMIAIKTDPTDLDRSHGNADDYDSSEIHGVGTSSKVEGFDNPQDHEKFDISQDSTESFNSSGQNEYYKEEKVEKESKIILRKESTVKNETSLVKGERRAEIKNNKESYHEAYLEERNENKYPSADNDNLRNRKSSQIKAFPDTMDKVHHKSNEKYRINRMFNSPDSNRYEIQSDVENFKAKTKENQKRDYIYNYPDHKNALNEIGESNQGIANLKYIGDSAINKIQQPKEDKGYNTRDYEISKSNRENNDAAGNDEKKLASKLGQSYDDYYDYNNRHARNDMTYNNQMYDLGGHDYYENYGGYDDFPKYDYDDRKSGDVRKGEEFVGGVGGNDKSDIQAMRDLLFRDNLIKSRQDSDGRNDGKWQDSDSRNLNNGGSLDQRRISMNIAPTGVSSHQEHYPLNRSAKADSYLGNGNGLGLSTTTSHGAFTDEESHSSNKTAAAERDTGIGNVVYMSVSTTTPRYNDFLQIREDKSTAHRRHIDADYGPSDYGT